ncbi:MAG: Uma2 family endonuclease [Lachnospiraceae bacterium]|nr:Uma2 family endonuclease [Lachnospiraceae bacterium]
MTIEEMREKKKELGYSYEQIADLADLPVGTVQKVLGGITKSPRYATIQALQKVFQEETGRKLVPGQIAWTTFPWKDAQDDRRCETPAADYGYNYNKKTSANDIFTEALSEYAVTKHQGEYTLEDYLALPEDQRFELIDGVIYDMASPTYIHQAIGDSLQALFNAYIRENHGACRAFTAPVDVQLDCDDKTMIQPDVLIVCDYGKLRSGRIYGAPDLVVEILSPSTSKKDRSLKLTKYKRAGVREYWIVDPDQKRVFVYEFEKSDSYVIYSFEDSVPVGIYDGKCRVDFRQIYDEIHFLYDTM